MIMGKFNLLEECNGAKNIFISGHVRPDGDCIGSCLAMYMYLKNALAGGGGKVIFGGACGDFQLHQMF